MNAIFTFLPMFNKNKNFITYYGKKLFDEIHTNQMNIEMNLHDRLYTTQNIPSPQGRKLSRPVLLKQRTKN